MDNTSEIRGVSKAVGSPLAAANLCPWHSPCDPPDSEMLQVVGGHRSVIAVFLRRVARDNVDGCEARHRYLRNESDSVWSHVSWFRGVRARAWLRAETETGHGS